MQLIISYVCSCIQGRELEFAIIIKLQPGRGQAEKLRRTISKLLTTT